MIIVGLVSFKDLAGASKKKDVFCPSQGNYQGCLTNMQGSRGSKQGNSKKRFIR